MTEIFSVLHLGLKEKQIYFPNYKILFGLGYKWHERLI
jgi:hypothetical protein